MDTPLYLNGYIVDSTDRIKQYDNGLFDSMILTINDVSCLFLTYDYLKSLSDIGRSMNSFMAVSKIQAFYPMTIKYKENTWEAKWNATEATINGDSVCQHWCDKRIQFQLNGHLTRSSCCKDYDLNGHHSAVFKSYSSINKENLHQRMLFAKFLLNLEFNGGPANPLYIFLALAMGGIENMEFISKAKESFSTMPDWTVFSLPTLKDPKHYKSLDKDTRYAVCQQIHSFDILKNSWKILPIVIDKDNVNLLDMGMHSKSMRLYSGYYRGNVGTRNIIPLLKLYYREFNRDKCKGIIPIRCSSEIKKDTIFITEGEVKSSLTSRDVSHYNYVLRYIKGYLIKKSS
jgi:hypothetical protein